MNPDTLEKYRQKRDFIKTPEPAGELKNNETIPRIFVIQKHRSRTLHYDLRLESGGVLKSWAVPKGPSMNPAVKRLAVPTEDHPMEYAGFEGIIPAGEYGAGEVSIWDRGYYIDLRKHKHGIPMEKSLEEGKVEFQLAGVKLRGGFVLIRTNRGGNWLLIKMRDREADPGYDPVEGNPESVLA